jgi:oligo-1,6-glucosidase
VRRPILTQLLIVLQIYGAFELLLRAHRTVFAYKRTLDGTTIVVLMNFGTEPVEIDDLASVGLETTISAPRIVLANYVDYEPLQVGGDGNVRLRGYEGVMYVLD